MKSGRIHRRHKYRCIFLFMLFLAASCTSSSPRINAGPDGIAIKGYDPVAYFTEGMPVKGFEAFSYEWNGARWLFSQEQHRDLFSADPEKYAPQYGGY